MFPGSFIYNIFLTIWFWREYGVVITKHWYKSLFVIYLTINIHYYDLHT